MTRWLSAAWWERNPEGKDRLVQALYPVLRRIAGQAFRRERRDHALQLTARVNEAWLRLSGSANLGGPNRVHLLTMAARLMREILIDHERRRAASKRDRGQRIKLDGLVLFDNFQDVDLLSLDTALSRLAQVDFLKLASSNSAILVA